MRIRTWKIWWELPQMSNVLGKFLSGHLICELY